MAYDGHKPVKTVVCRSHNLLLGVRTITLRKKGTVIEIDLFNGMEKMYYFINVAPRLMRQVIFILLCDQVKEFAVAL